MNKNGLTIAGIECLSGKRVHYNLITGTAAELPDAEFAGLPFIGPGLVDLQVNGIAGIDFNSFALSEAKLLAATNYLFSQGVTSFFPTIITNGAEEISHLLKTIATARSQNPLLEASIAGIHLEGPFISKKDGARGAHDEKFVRSPDWKLMLNFQRAAAGLIKLVTLSPEWDNAPEFIKACRKNGILVSIGHSAATPEQVQKAVNAGASLSTHLGNAVPLVLPRHPNILWEQLAQDRLYTSVIADGFHVPLSFLKVVMRAKGRKCFLVSDATSFSGMKPGVYTSHIGGEVRLEENGRLSMVAGDGLLAGATFSLLQNVEYLLKSGLTNLKTAWQMASVRPLKIISKRQSKKQNTPTDTVIFNVHENSIRISSVYKNGRLVFSGKGELQA